jgi:trehalose/maltose hydrolase-like predicted phosphorylase
MKLSRRSLAKQCIGMLAVSAVPRQLWPAWEPCTSSYLSPTDDASSLPKFVVEDFSKVFDPAYLSNGMVGIRPGPNPLARSQTCVSGFVFAHVPYGMESLSPAPYPLETDVRINGVSLLKHTDLLHILRQTLDTSCGELTTKMVFNSANGLRLDMEVLQFASRSVPALICQEIQVTASGDSSIEFVSKIDTEGVPGHLYLDQAPEGTQIDLVVGFESGGNLSKLGAALWILSPDVLARRQDLFRTETGPTQSYVVKAAAGRPLRFRTIAASVSELYHPEPALEAIRLASWGRLLGFERLREQNRSAWAELWKSRVKVSGDTDAQRVLDASFFYLHSSLHSSIRTGMPPFGLSQFRHYYGHSFWDTETWSLLPVTLAAPPVARSLLEFRLRSLKYAERQAALYGYQGAQFPWEAAASNGFETTPTFAGTGWGEQHATPDVALGFWEYQLATNDQSFLREGAWPVLRSVAAWIESRGVYTDRGFEIRNVMGPDEGVPNINNVSYMNLISKMVMAAAIRCAQMVGSSVPDTWKKIKDRLVLPVDKTSNIVLPYDNPPDSHSVAYSRGQMDFLVVHDSPLSVELLRSTHEFEEAHKGRPTGALMPTSDFSIGFAAAAVAASAAFLGEKKRAAELFAESWRPSWLEPFGMIRETPLQDYGCFLTNYGSFLQTAMFGFTGLRINEGEWTKYPASLPEGWNKIEIDRIYVRGEAKKLTATDGARAQLVAI